MITEFYTAGEISKLVIQSIFVWLSFFGYNPVFPTLFSSMPLVLMYLILWEKKGF